jgi:tetratricopeptide (TPR) repeat protein
MDFFVAKDDAETAHLLHLVEIAHTNRILPQISSKDYRGALSDIKYTLNRFPNHPRGLVLMGLYGRLMKTHALAMPYYEKAIRLYPQYALTRAQYGAYMVSLGNLDEGIKKLITAVEIDPDLAFAHVWLAAAYYKRGNVELGRGAETKARELGFDGKISLDIPQDAPSRK